jgi:4-amino-4-deoxy-L-arabinose transferase-like glycosyltransferase
VKKVQKVWLVRATSIIFPLIVAAVSIGIAVRFNNTGDRWFASLIGWTAGWFFALIAIARWEMLNGRPVYGRQSPEPRWRRAEVIALAVILLAAALLRVVAIESYPIALHNDEMSCLFEARGFVESERPIFDLGWFNCPNFGFFLTSLPMRILGPTLFALRLNSALLGLLSLIAVYLVVRRLFGVRPAMLLLILSTPFHWHLHFSRAGFHYMQATSFTAVAVLLFIIAVDRRSPVLFGCAGVVTGIAWQTYYAAWLTPLILSAWVLVRLISDREQGKTAVKGFIVTMVLFVVTTAPLLAFYAERPSGATSRPTSVFLFSEQNREHIEFAYGTSSPAGQLVTSAERYSRFFVGGAGDTSVQYGLQGRFIDPFLLPLFLAGLAYALTLVRHPGGQLLWIWFLGTMISGGLLTIDAPFSPRLTGITPIILLFPALLVDRILRIRWIADRRWRWIADRRWLAAATFVVFGAVVGFSTWWNLHTTFVRYPRMKPVTHRDFIVRLAVDLGNVAMIANFADPENFDHPAYPSLLPEVRGENMGRSMTRVEDYVNVVNALGPRTLVIAPLVDKRFYGLCDRVGGDPAGIVVTGEGSAAFEWCFVK